MLRGGARDPARSRDRVHQAVELALTEPGDLAAATANDALERIVGDHEVTGAQRLNRHLFDPCGLGTSAALDDLLDHRAGRLARLVLPMVVAAAQHQSLLSPDDLAADREAGRFELSATVAACSAPCQT